MPAYVVLVTAPSGEKAASIAKALVEQKLAACVNRVAGVQSTYVWKGALVEEAEDLLLIKTDKTKFKALVKAVKALHPASVPEVLALRVKEGERSYLSWLLESVQAPRKKIRIPAGKPKKLRLPKPKETA
jgi:periplasmic divalent cation tolerance protein